MQWESTAYGTVIDYQGDESHVNNHRVCRSQVRFLDNLGTKTLAIMLVVGCIIAIVLIAIVSSSERIYSLFLNRCIVCT